MRAARKFAARKLRTVNFIPSARHSKLPQTPFSRSGLISPVDGAIVCPGPNLILWQIRRIGVTWRLGDF